MLLRDFVLAARTLRKSPVFTVTAALTIALGVGASTAIFSVSNALLLSPLPYKRPDRLVLACVDMTRRNVTDWGYSNADYLDLRNAAKTNFEDISGVATSRILWTGPDGTPEQIRVARVTYNFFQMMGAQIAAGRDFTEADGQPQPAAPAAGASNTQGPPPARLPTNVILSYEFWKRRYGGDGSVIGRAAWTTGGGGPQIVGVLAPGFELLLPPKLGQESKPDVWFAARIAYDNAQRNSVTFRAIARLRDGVTLEKAQAEADRVAAEIAKVDAIHQTVGLRIRLEPMHQYLVSEVRPAILALMGAVTFLLLIACANVANLLLVRVSLRERELAVRTALGASGWRLVRQMLAEAALLAGLGTLAGIGLAWLGVQELLRMAPANLPRLQSIALDPVVLGFSVIAGLISAAVFGLAPAWRGSRPNVMQVLAAGGRAEGLGGGRILRNSVVIAEVALSFVLLIGSGLMFRSFLALQRIDPGYDPHSLLTFSLLGGRGGSVPQQRAAFMREIHSRLRALPGVESVTASNPFPLAGGFNPIRWGLEPALTDPTKFQAVDFQIVLPGYFEAMRTRLREGRAFTDADNAPERNGVIIDQALAAKAFPSESAVGKRILIRIRTPEPEWVEVLGVAAHQRNTSLAEAGREQVYFTDGFLGHGAVGRWALRTTGDPGKLAAAVRAEITKLDPRLLITEMQPMDALVQRAQAKTRFSLILIGAFAVVAALLAAVGLYGVLSTVVRQQTAEIGVRMALGAAPANIFRLIVGHGLALSVAGIVAGLATALGLTRVMTTLLVNVTPTDPITFAAMVVLFLLIAALASWLPARRAAGLDPSAALRQE